MPKSQTQPAEAPAPPEGAAWNRADTDVDSYPSWEFESQGDLQGKVVKVKSVDLIRRGESVPVRMAIVERDDGKRYCLWESANLADFFDKIQPAHEILVQPAGAADLGGARTMKLYRAYFRR